MVPIATAVGIGIGTLMVVTIVVTLMTGSLFAVAVVIALMVLLAVVLMQYGFLRVTIQNGQISVSLFEAPKEPTPAVPKETARPLTQGKEVFHISDNRFVYDEAPAVCAAYGAEIATQEQVDEAYAQGAEWCGYGWSAGGVALFPTQKATWELLQREVDPAKRTACGRPGVNGGYFDPTLKFGVNCYGVKPKGSLDLPLPPPGVDNSAFQSQVNVFKNQIASFFMRPFNRGQWSEYDYGAQFKQSIGRLADGTPGTVNPHPPAVVPGSGPGNPQ